MIGYIGLTCLALAFGGTVCLEKAEHDSWRVACISPLYLADAEGVKLCEVSTTGTIVIVPER